MGKRQRLANSGASGAPKCPATGKTIFFSRKRAEEVLRHILDTPATMQSLYKPADIIDCRSCDGFHLTSREARPGLAARRRRGPRSSHPHSTPHWQRSEPRIDNLPQRQAGTSWTSGFLDTPNEPHLTHRIDIRRLDRGSVTSAS